MSAAVSKTIMVIDDSGSFRTIVKIALNKAGYTVVEAANGSDAIGKLDQAKPALILCDLHMPEMDGISFAHKLRANPSHKFTPIVMVTTASDEAKRKEGAAAGVKAWVLKPVQPSTLLDAITRLCPQ